MNATVGVMALAIAFHLGARSAGAGITAAVVDAEFDTDSGVFLLTENGQVYGNERAICRPESWIR